MLGAPLKDADGQWIPKYILDTVHRHGEGEGGFDRRSAPGRQLLAAATHAIHAVLLRLAPNPIATASEKRET